MKVEQKQTLNKLRDTSHNSSNNNSSNFNLVADQVPTVTYHKKSLVDTLLLKDKEMDAFLDENTSGQVQESFPIHSEEKIPQEIKCLTSDLAMIKKELLGEFDDPSSINHNNITKVSETTRPKKVTYSIDEASQHLAQLCDKAIDTEDRANWANQEEILYQLDEIIRSNSGKFGEEKARDMFYDTITEQLSILYYSISLKKLSLEASHVSEFSETAHPKKILPEENSAEVSDPMSPIPLAHISNSSDDSKEANPSNSLEVEDDFYKMLLEDCAKNCVYLVDFIPPSCDPEKEMLNDFDDDRYNGYGEYNEYGEHDRGYYCCDGRYKRKTFLIISPIISLLRYHAHQSMVRKKNKRHIQSTLLATSASANEIQSRSLIVIDTELQELIHQGLVVDEVHEVLEYDRKSMSWIDNFIHLSIKLKNQCDDPREKYSIEFLLPTGKRYRECERFARKIVDNMNDSPT
ncbi:hypothetical protein C1645_814168 [Glomus cerebriforme]|uniref:Uncharacterized protein n=1 Tax=Glomus cerebriforme TaxID=658196 RepID=A0A397TQH3_9GLOM|nr:hypothetical protein C1645_814168 [Glomus cerebriforme]